MHLNYCQGQAVTPCAGAGRKRRLGKGAETTRFADVRASLLPGYPRKPSRLSGGTGWYLLYLRERVRERVLIAQHARELLWPVIR